VEVRGGERARFQVCRAAVRAKAASLCPVLTSVCSRVAVR
jgi:hypothetical protein